MLLYAVLGLAALVIALAVFWYVQTRNVEIARYEVLQADGPVEIRAYPALTVAEVVRSGTREQAVRAGFGPLARYIFAKERSGGKIAMTAPVMQTPDDAAWTVQFVMPSQYRLEQLPSPSDADVTLHEIPAAKRAAIRFSGWWSDENFAKKDAELKAWLAARGLQTSGPPSFAYYNDPFTPGFLRRNEVSYDLK